MDKIRVEFTHEELYKFYEKVLFSLLSLFTHPPTHSLPPPPLPTYTPQTINNYPLS